MADAANTAKYKNILVINLMHIGDLMLVTPVLRTLRANYPQSRITLLADLKLRDLVEHNKWIDDCMLIDKKGKDDHLLNFIKFIMKIRNTHFDLVINLHRNERASALAAFSGANRVIGYAKPGFSFFFSDVFPNKKAVEHQIQSHFEVLLRSGVVDHIDDGGLEMWITPEDDQKAQKLWDEHFAPGRKVVALNIGASWETKRWLDTYFADVADDLIEHGYAIAFYGGPGDTGIVRACIDKMAHHNSPELHVFTGKLSLAVLAGMLKRSALFITTDSGPMHVGVAMNVPIVTMFGSSPVPGFYPYDEKDVLIKTPEKCHPCGIHVCPRKGEEFMGCMKHIKPDVVLRYAYRLLDTYGDSAGVQPAHYGQYHCEVIDLAEYMKHESHLKDRI